MDGLTHILETINNNAANAADAEISKAKSDADDILAAARKTASEEEKAILEKAEKQKKNELESASSRCEMNKRQAVLAAKASVISEVIKSAKEKFLSLDDASYFKALENICKEFALEGEGEMLLCKKDLGRMPGGFADALSAALDPKKKVFISKDTADIDGGFILRYGSIEQNCSIDALIEDRSDELRDGLNKRIFGTEEA